VASKDNLSKKYNFNFLYTKRSISKTKRKNFEVKFSLESAVSGQELVRRIHRVTNTGLSKKMDGIWKRYNLKSTGRIYMFGVLKCSEEFKVLDLP